MLGLASSYTFGDALLTVIEVFLFVAWLFLLFYVFADLFRSHDLSGFAKALWTLGLIFFPVLGTLVYLLVRGGEMHERADDAQRASQDAVNRYIRQAAGTQGSASVDQVERLSALHRQGALSDQEYQQAKDQLLAPAG